MIKSLSMRRRRPEEINLNLTSLIDVVFLLLIFFMITTTFKSTDQIGVELPSTYGTKAMSIQNVVRLSITEEGSYRFQDKALGFDLGALELALKKTALDWDKSHKTGTLLLLGDKKAPHQAVVSAMDIAQKVGITQIRIMTEHSHS